jgi:hypothetical protein
VTSESGGQRDCRDESKNYASTTGYDILLIAKGKIGLEIYEKHHQSIDVVFSR